MENNPHEHPSLIGKPGLYQHINHLHRVSNYRKYWIPFGHFFPPNLLHRSKKANTRTCVRDTRGKITWWKDEAWEFAGDNQTPSGIRQLKFFAEINHKHASLTYETCHVIRITSTANNTWHSVTFIRLANIRALLFCTTTNRSTITLNSHTITLLHVSTLSCLPQWARNQYLAKLHKYFKCSCW